MSREPSIERADRFDAVFAEVYEPLQRYMRRRARPEDVDDLVADVLLVVWRRLDDVPADVALPWCYGVARRCLANHTRSQTRGLRLVHRLARERPSEGPALAADLPLGRALAALPALDQEVLRLWAWEGLAPREIATVMSLTPNAVSIRLHRAKAKLAAKLGKDPDPAGHNQVDKPSGAHLAPWGSDATTSEEGST